MTEFEDRENASDSWKRSKEKRGVTVHLRHAEVQACICCLARMREKNLILRAGKPDQGRKGERTHPWEPRPPSSSSAVVGLLPWFVFFNLKRILIGLGASLPPFVTLTEIDPLYSGGRVVEVFSDRQHEIIYASYSSGFNLIVSPRDFLYLEGNPHVSCYCRARSHCSSRSTTIR